MKGCRHCGKSTNSDGSPVTWVCASCKGLVCRDCTLTHETSSVTVEYLGTTYCSEKCRLVLRTEGIILGHNVEDL